LRPETAQIEVDDDPNRLIQRFAVAMQGAAGPQRRMLLPAIDTVTSETTLFTRHSGVAGPRIDRGGARHPVSV
jgi:hypothetical protein